MAIWSAGIAVGNAADMAEVRLVGIKDMTGAIMAPFNAMLVMRGLKTLKLRMAEHCRSAMVIADMLEAHPAVAAVHYPGLASFWPTRPGHSADGRIWRDDRVRTP